MRSHHFLPVFITLIALYLSLHLYSSAWIARNSGMSAGAARALRISFLLLAFLAPFTMFLRRHYTHPSLDLLYAAGDSWMGIIFLAGFAFIFADILRFALDRISGPALLPSFPIFFVTALGAILIYSFYGGHSNPVIKELRLPVTGLPPAMEGLKIAQISDVHLNSAHKLERFSKILERLNRYEPDLIFFTGDLVDPGLPDGIDPRELTRALKPRLGMYGILGNHEYYFGYEKSLAFFKAAGIIPLRNGIADLAGFRIIGLNDIVTEGMTQEEVRGLLTKHGKPGQPALLMSHQPLMYEAMAETGDYIGFSGHTHRGQIFPFSLFTRLFYKHFYGLYRIKGSLFYVTSGTGTWGPPMRFLAPSEIPMITLTGK